MLTMADVGARTALRKALLDQLGVYGLKIELHPLGNVIPGSYWGEPEAGIIGSVVHARSDTPLHSLLHEACHLICMGPERRRDVASDAGGDDLEEAAVCYLQLLIAQRLPGIGWRRLARDMDAWGYSFRHGSTVAWFCEDAHDAAEWLCRRGLTDRASMQASASC